MVSFLKKYYLWIALLFVLLGASLEYYSKKLVPEQISYFNYNSKGEKVDTVFYQLTTERLTTQVLSNVFYTIGISIFVSLLILKRIEEEEKKAFENRLIEIQEGVNKDVLESVFKKFINPELFDLLRKDIFSQETIRKNANWSIEILDNGSSFTSKIIMTHEIHNNTNNEALENVKIMVASENDNSWIEYLKLQDDSKKVIAEENFNKNQKMQYNEEFKIKPNGFLIQTLIVNNIYLKYDNFDFIWAVAPTLGLEIEFLLSDNCDIEIHPTFSTKLERRIDTDNKILFHTIPAILPGQGIQIVLRKKLNKNIPKKKP